MMRALLLSTLTVCAPVLASEDGRPVEPGMKVRISTGPRVERNGFMLSSGYQKGRSIAEDEQSVTFDASGQALRLARPNLTVIGTLSLLDDHALTIDASRGERIVVPRDAVAKLEIQRGRRNHGVGGALLGFAVTGSFCYVALGRDPFLRASTSGERLRGAVISGGLGAALGAAIGIALRDDRWQDARIGVTPSSDGAALTLALRF